METSISHLSAGAPKRNIIKEVTSKKFFDVESLQEPGRFH